MSQFASIWEMPEHERRVAIVKRQVRGARKALGYKHDILFIEASTPAPAMVAERTFPADMPTWRRILFETARKHHVSPSEILSAQRSRPIVAARHECMYRMKTETTMSLPQIARRLNRADHSTVHHGVAMHRAKVEKNTPLSPLSTQFTGDVRTTLTVR